MLGGDAGSFLRPRTVSASNSYRPDASNLTCPGTGIDLLGCPNLGSAYSADEGQPVLLEQGGSTGLVMKDYPEVICSELGGGSAIPEFVDFPSVPYNADEGQHDHSASNDPSGQAQRCLRRVGDAWFDCFRVTETEVVLNKISATAFSIRIRVAVCAA